MSTRAYVGYLTESGIFKYIYVHNDGYPEGVGQTLLDHYDLKKTMKLVKLGSASSIYKNLNPTEGSGHNFDNREDDVCVFYIRDRGEPKLDNKAITVNELDFHLLLNDVNYIYLIDQKGTWFVSDDNDHCARLDSHPEISKNKLTIR